MRTSTIKSVAALALTGAGSALVLGFRTSSDLGIDDTAPADAQVAAHGAPTGGSTAGAGQTSTPTDGSTATGRYADGTWTGDAVAEPWGPFQVAVVISDGTIAQVRVVASPSDRHSSSINRQAVPILTESVLASDGASVHMVSGATWTSDSYARSLQSALDAAAQAA